MWVWVCVCVFLNYKNIYTIYTLYDILSILHNCRKYLLTQTPYTRKLTIQHIYASAILFHNLKYVIHRSIHVHSIVDLSYLKRAFCDCCIPAVPGILISRWVRKRKHVNIIWQPILFPIPALVRHRLYTYLLYLLSRWKNRNLVAEKPARFWKKKLIKCQ